MRQNALRRGQHQGEPRRNDDGVRLIPVCVIASTCVNAEHTEGGVTYCMCESGHRGKPASAGCPDEEQRMRTITNRGGVLVFKERAGKPGGQRDIDRRR